LGLPRFFHLCRDSRFGLKRQLFPTSEWSFFLPTPPPPPFEFAPGSVSLASCRSAFFVSFAARPPILMMVLSQFLIECSRIIRTFERKCPRTSLLFTAVLVVRRTFFVIFVLLLDPRFLPYGSRVASVPSLLFRRDPAHPNLLSVDPWCCNGAGFPLILLKWFCGSSFFSGVTVERGLIVTRSRSNSFFYRLHNACIPTSSPRRSVFQGHPWDSIREPF